MGEGGAVGLAAELAAKRGPAEIVLVRHGESAGNLADAQARKAGAGRLELSARDADVELSDTGHDQAAAVGRWLAAVAEDDRPTLVLSSPYRRAADTGRAAVDGTGLEVVLDERLRERDLGLFDGLTRSGIEAEYPQEAERRQKLGKFYYQPPSGESWADVVLRVRTLLADLREGYDGARVWAFTHQAVIMAFRYALEDLDEAALLEVDRTERLPNASFTTYRRTDQGFALATFADTTAVEQSAAEETAEPVRAGRGDPADG
jgi:broad specificity phosphatase PhoE